MVTIRDVAKAADVSISTVSRVINNSPNVTREKKNRVLAAIEAVGYIPNIKPKENGADPARVILVITTIFHYALCPAIEENASDMGYEVLFKYTGEYENGIHKKVTEGIYKEILKSRWLSGIILLNPSMNKDTYLDSFMEDYPVVQVGCSVRDYGGYSVATDDFQASYDMTSYLLSRGYRRIALVTPNDQMDASHYSYTNDRYYGYHKALEMAGGGLEECVIYCDQSMKGGHEAAKQVLALENRPDAIFCLLDKIALGCMRELMDAGLRIPEDIGVAGYDGDSWGAELTPSLTTVIQSFDDIGAEAVQMMDQAIRGEISNGRRLFVAHHIEARESTK